MSGEQSDEAVIWLPPEPHLNPGDERWVPDGQRPLSLGPQAVCARGVLLDVFSPFPLPVGTPAGEPSPEPAGPADGVWCRVDGARNAGIWGERDVRNGPDRRWRSIAGPTPTMRPARPKGAPSMRKFVLLAAAMPLLFAPAASAGEQRPDRESECRVPDIDLSYDTETFTAMVSLPASGCPSREHTQFDLSASISRLDNEGGRDLVERTATCGPFRSADDFESDQTPPQYYCNLAVFLDHPPVENAQYDVNVSYPGAAAERTMSVFRFCTSDGDTAACQQ